MSWYIHQPNSEPKIKQLIPIEDIAPQSLVEIPKYPPQLVRYLSASERDSSGTFRSGATLDKDKALPPVPQEEPSPPLPPIISSSRPRLGRRQLVLHPGCVPKRSVSFAEPESPLYEPRSPSVKRKNSSSTTSGRLRRRSVSMPNVGAEGRSLDRR